MLALLVLLLGCGPEEELRQSTGTLVVTPMGPIESFADLALDGTDEPLQTIVTLLNEGPGTVDVLSTRVVHLSGEQDWHLTQGFEAPLRRGEQAELVVSYDPDFESESEASLTVLIDGVFEAEQWDADQAEILLTGAATEL